MKRILLALALLCPTIASAQLVKEQVGTVGVYDPTIVNRNGAVVGGVIPQVSLGTGTSSSQVQGNVASGATDSGNPVEIGGTGNSGQPTAVSIGQRVKAWFTLNGAQQTSVGLGATGTDGSSNNLTWLLTPTGVGLTPMASFVYNSNWDRARSIQGVDGTGLGVAATAISPNSSANTAIASVPSAAAESNHVIKASAGNLYRASITTGGTAGYLMVFDATSAPADGAVTPAICRAVAANSSIEASFASLPVRFSTGVTVVFSSTGCFTKTASATAYFEGYAK